MDDADLVTMLFRRAETHGVSIARLCHHARIAPTTPSRWRRRRNGATLDRVTRLHAALDDLIRDDAERRDDSADEEGGGGR